MAQTSPSRAAARTELRNRRAVVRLLEQHIVAENRENIKRIMRTMTACPLYVMRYLPFNISDQWWWSRKYWKGYNDVVRFYDGLFAAFKGFRLTLLYYAVSSKGIVDCYRLRGRIFSRLLNFPRLGIDGISIRLTLYSFLPYDAVAQKLAGEQVYFTSRALANLI